MLDTGATANTTDETTYQGLRYKPSLTKCMVPIFPYHSLPVIGKLSSVVESKTQFANATSHVLQGSNGSLFDYGITSQQGLINVANILRISPQ